MRASWRTLGVIFFFGTLWGASEVLLGEGLRRAGLPYGSSVLTVVALLVLTLADRVLPRLGSLAAVAGVAALYRLITAGPFWCHLVAILALGILFDGVRQVVPLRSDRPVRTAATAVGLAYGAHFVFAALMTWVYRYGPWVGAGMGRLRDHVLVSGTLAAVVAAVLVPAAARAADGRRGRAPGAEGPAPALRGALALGVAVLLWGAGFLAGR